MPSPDATGVHVAAAAGETRSFSSWRGIALGLLIAATVAYYFWTAMIEPGGPPRIHGNESDHFNLLSRGFLKGQLSLDLDVPEALLHAANPYDPAQRQNVSVLHDASLFRGRYYIYFGPAPVVTLMLPFRLITGRDLPLPYAVWLFASFGYLALSGTFLLLQRRHFPRASLWSTSAGLIALGGASMTVALLRRPNIWELSASAGFCFFACALGGLVVALHSTRPARWAGLAALALGLAVASRPTYLLCAPLLGLPWLHARLGREPRSRRPLRAVLFAAGAGFGVPLFALLGYNAARFGNPLEFGQRYQLSAIIEGAARHFSFSYVPFNFHVHFLSPLRWIPQFPFVDGIVVPRLPPDFGGYEFTFGIFSNLPFSVFGLVAGVAALAVGRRGAGLALALRFSLIAIAAAAAINAGLMLTYFGSCVRYLVDFTPWFMLLAALGILGAEAGLRTAPSRALIRAAALGLAIASAANAAASVVIFYDSIEGEPPRAYHPVARLLNRPIHLLSQRRWPNFGARELRFTLPADATPRRESLATISRDGRVTAAVFVDFLDGANLRLGYREPGAVRPSRHSPAVPAAPGVAHVLRLSIGGPYSDFNGVRGRLRAQFDGVTLWDLPAVSFSAYPGELKVGRDADAVPDLAPFSGELHSVQPAALAELAPPHIAGVRVRLTIRPGMIGRAYPLISTGRTKAGDILSIGFNPDHTLQFAYDHWGDALIKSPAVPVQPNQTLVIEFWVPALAPPGADDTLIVRVDDAIVWRRSAPAYRAAPDEVFLGANPIGGSSSEREIENAVFEAVQLPFPR